jgi:hypothetical protein
MASATGELNPEIGEIEHRDDEDNATEGEVHLLKVNETGALGHQLRDLWREVPAFLKQTPPFSAGMIGPSPPIFACCLSSTCHIAAICILSSGFMDA